MQELFRRLKRSLNPTAFVEAPPTEFVTQILEPTGGNILRPAGWFYRENHRGATLDWTLSREEPAERRAYTTGVRIQAFTRVESATGKTPRQFLLDLRADRARLAAKVLKTCEETEQEFFTRTCLEAEERQYHVLYSFFWGNNDMDIAVVVIAGTLKPLWETYAATFDKMSALELIDMTRFEE